MDIRMSTKNTFEISSDELYNLVDDDDDFDKVEAAAEQLRRVIENAVSVHLGRAIEVEYND